MGLTFYIVDVFAEERYAGNQLAVVRGAGGLSDGEMQKIALEMNYSETTFVMGEEGGEAGGEAGGFDVRIFTPAEEIPFAGHPTLGTAYVIRHEILGDEAPDRPVERVTLNLKAGCIPVTFGEVLRMRQLPPSFGPAFDPALVARVLNLRESDLDEHHPVQEVSTGLPAIVIPLRSLDALKRCRVDRGRYLDLVSETEAKNLYVFCPEAHEESNDLAARMFADHYGVPEDPATGSAAGCLAGYLVEHRYLGTETIDVRVEQGYEIDRPSLLYLQAGGADNGISVSVGGKVQMVARGELL